LISISLAFVVPLSGRKRSGFETLAA